MSLNELDEGRLAAAVDARESGHDESALSMLLELQRDHPDDAAVNLHCAWIHDKLGREAEAVPFYEKALELGLEEDDRNHALLGLGSTYRALGRHAEALTKLGRGVQEFPHDPGMAVFHAMALYNNGMTKEACESLLTVIGTTAQTPELARYQPAIIEYARDLDRVWE